MATDLLGRPLTANETRLLAAYEDLKAFVQLEDLPPSALANARVALAAVAVAATDLGLVYEHLHELGL